MRHRLRPLSICPESCGLSHSFTSLIFSPFLAHLSLWSDVSFCGSFRRLLSDQRAELLNLVSLAHTYIFYSFLIFCVWCPLWNSTKYPLRGGSNLEKLDGGGLFGWHHGMFLLSDSVDGIGQDQFYSNVVSSYPIFSKTFVPIIFHSLTLCLISKGVVSFHLLRSHLILQISNWYSCSEQVKHLLRIWCNPVPLGQDAEIFILWVYYILDVRNYHSQKWVSAWFRLWLCPFRLLWQFIQSFFSHPDSSGLLQ